ncbi:MAG: transcription elongation factor GreA [Chlorobi bacterium]|nr:transcription elongation factor GreA [Chlorobiota bacterium]
MSYEFISEEAFQKLNDELQYLKTEGRRKVAKQLQEAREKGDLSENAEYDAAKEAQALLEQRIARLEEILSRVKVVSKDKIDTSKVNILTKVKVQNLRTGQTMFFRIVSESEANFKEGKISTKSPIGKALMGHKVGDVVEIQVPAGQLQFKILEITV